MKRLLLAAAMSLAALPAMSQPAKGSAAEIAASSQTALQALYAKNEKARTLGAKATAILVFPRIVKAGLMVGGQGGDGALIEDGKVVAFYNIAAGSFGFQAGAQTFSYAMIFANEKALDYLKKSDGWSVGTGPSVVVMDQGKALSTTSTTLTHDVYAFPFGQHGLMAGTGIEGSKITQIHPDP